MDLDPFSLRFFNDVRYEVSAIFVVQGCANLGIVDHLVESESHAASNYHLINDVK